MLLAKDCSGRHNECLTFVSQGLSPNPGPGRRPLDSGRRDVGIVVFFAPITQVHILASGPAKKIEFGRATVR